MEDFEDFLRPENADQLSAFSDPVRAVIDVGVIVVSKLNRGSKRRELGNLLYHSLKTAVERGERISKQITRGGAASQLGLDKNSTTFTEAIQRFTQAQTSCRPSRSKLLPQADDREGTAALEALIDGKPHLVIVRGPLAEHRNDTDDQLRLRIQFRAIEGSPAVAVSHNAATSAVARVTATSYTQKLLNLPLSRNPAFIGRDEVLNALTSAVNSQVPRIDVLAGISGIGKTELAFQFAYTEQHKFDIIWWVRSGDAVVIQQSYRELASVLALIDENTLAPEVTTRLKGYLERTGRWLLIFDNVSEYETVRDFLPRIGTGRVLITSLNPSWRRFAHVHELEPFSTPQACQFMVRRTDLDADPSAIAEDLGCLPLALEYAAAYIESRGLTYDEYHALFRDYRENLLRAEGSHLSPLVVVWNISFRSVEAENPVAADVLRLASFMGPAPIPQEFFLWWLSGQTGTLPDWRHMRGGQITMQTIGSADRVRFEDAIGVLRRYSLVNRRGPEIVVHQLLQDVIRTNTPDDARPRLAALALDNTYDLVRLETVRAHSSTIAASLLPHVASVCAPQEVATSDNVMHLLIIHAIYLQARGSYAEALLLLEECEARTRSGQVTPALHLGILIQKAILWRAMGRPLADRRELLLRANEISKNVDRSNEYAAVRYLDFRIVLGAFFFDAGEYGQALETLQALQTELNGKDVGGPDAISSVNANIAITLARLGRLPEAIDHIRRALDRDLATFGDTHPTVALRFATLGEIYLHDEKPVAARDAFAEALRINSTSWGDGHPSTLRTRFNHAVASLASGDSQGALRDVEYIWESATSQWSPEDVMQLRLLKSGALENLGRLEAALSEIEAVVAASGNLDRAAFNLDVLRSRQKAIRDALANTSRSTQSEKRRRRKDKT